MIIAVDPSINQTGWAYNLNGKEISGVIKTKGNSDPEKIRDLIFKLSAVMKELYSARLLDSTQIQAVVEIAEGFGYARSTNHYGKQQNVRALLKNAKATGAIIGQLTIRDIQVVEIGATFWKGKMNKKMGQMITQKSNNNEADAIMLLRWWIQRGQFLKKEGVRI